MRKNSFVLYTDCLEQLEVIPDAERGILFLEVLRYARTGVVPNIENPFLKALFLGFKNQIDRDCAKYGAGKFNGTIWSGLRADVHAGSG